MRSEFNSSFFWYKMLFARGYGPKTLFKIVKAFRTKEKGRELSELCSLEKEEFRELLLSLDKLPNLATYESFMNACQISPYGFQDLLNKKVKLVHPDHSLYPETLEQMEKAYVLSCYGNLKLLKEPGVAIVGSRNCSKTALHLTEMIVRELARNGIRNIISGFAKGVDTKAHTSAMENNIYTTAVLSYGILRFLNSRSNIFDTERALVISQFRPDQQWSKQNAMMRNELVCILAKALIVVESGPKRNKNGNHSGTFAAAETALNMKKPVYVVHPALFEAPPEGNAQLLEKKGTRPILGNLEDSIRDLVSTLISKKNHHFSQQLNLPF